ncbi:thioredoxin [Natronococcus pandeyae]|uniref:Thioredoxin n=1 Tax=Natronococcus pandeyae TaxID=2055836 RepID=A0A8J8Q0R8_9EURY|nr:thioredoxin [Natronococcus pandeyae]
MTAQSEASTPVKPVYVDGLDDLTQITTDHPFVLVEFCADRCGPCKRLDSVLKSIAADTGITVAKVDIDKNPQLAFVHRARSVPMIELYSNGERVERIIGVPSERDLRELIRRYARSAIR